jgi:hypothetical protein
MCGALQWGILVGRTCLNTPESGPGQPRLSAVVNIVLSIVADFVLKDVPLKPFADDQFSRENFLQTCLFSPR